MGCPEYCDDGGGVWWPPLLYSCTLVSSPAIRPVQRHPERGNTVTTSDKLTRSEDQGANLFVLTRDRGNLWLQNTACQRSWIVLSELVVIFQKWLEHGMENVSFPVFVLFFLLRGWIGGCHWRITGSTKRNKVCKAQLSPELCKGRVQLSSRFCYRLFAGTSPLPNITTKKEEIQKTWKYWQKHKTFPHALILIQWKVITFLMDNS